MALDLEHIPGDDLKKMLGDALDKAKKAMDEGADHVDAADAVSEAIDIWKELRKRGLL